jgi:predicted PhzF superfamily epimerase YddE/YHI9
MKRRFDQLDVFTAEALRGNPLAVVQAREDRD